MEHLGVFRQGNRQRLSYNLASIAIIILVWHACIYHFYHGAILSLTPNYLIYTRPSYIDCHFVYVDGGGKQQQTASAPLCKLTGDQIQTSLYEIALCDDKRLLG